MINAQQPTSADWFDQYQNPVMPGGVEGAPVQAPLTINDIPGRNPQTGAIDVNTPLAGGGSYVPPQQPVQAPQTASSVGSDPSAFGRAWLASGGKTVADLQAFVKAHPEFGASLTGSKGDKVQIGGKVFDAVQSAGLGGIAGTWNDVSSGAGGQAGTMAGVNAGQFTAPFTERFSLPSLADLKGMPGYQAGLDAATNATQRSAAAQGTLLTGGLQRRLGQVASDYASQQYGNLAGMKLGEFGTNRDIAYRNQDAPFAKLSSLAQLGKP